MVSRVSVQSSSLKFQKTLFQIEQRISRYSAGDNGRYVSEASCGNSICTLAEYSIEKESRGRKSSNIASRIFRSFLLFERGTFTTPRCSCIVEKCDAGQQAGNIPSLLSIDYHRYSEARVARQ